jgi:hypothetical protein
MGTDVTARKGRNGVVLGLGDGGEYLDANMNCSSPSTTVMIMIA